MKIGGWKCWRKLTLLLAGAGLAATAAAATAQSRGELLYTTQCVGCHSAQMHWRDKRQATDWPSLLSQVRQWQARALLNWSDEDILVVARHLNDTVYRFATPGSSGATAKASRPTCTLAPTPAQAMTAAPLATSSGMSSPWPLELAASRRRWVTPAQGACQWRRPCVDPRCSWPDRAA